MSSERNQNRRDRIMKSQAELPGDQARAEAEENEDFDAPDTGNFRAHQTEGKRSNPKAQDKINRSEAELPGDARRGKDDQSVDAGETHTTRNPSDSGRKAAHDHPTPRTAKE